jgi:2-iminobutanoate/2-iminopropanoate deaminase
MTIEKKVVSTHNAPAAIGPYSQAIVANGFVFISGQIPLDPSTGQLVDGGIESQTRQVLDNLAAILETTGATWDRVVRATIYLTDLADFAAVNQLYAERFSSAPPARSTLQVAALPRGSKIEIDLIALA